MTTIYARVQDQVLVATILPKLACNNRKSVKLHVDFDAVWDGYAKSALFTTSNDPTVYAAMLDSNGECTIPHEVLADQGYLFITIQGINSSTGQLKSTTPISYKILPGTPSLVVSAPSPGVYEQLATKTKVLEARLNIAETGATVDSEVAGIRAGADGVQYPSAGDAVRIQLDNQIKTDYPYPFTLDSELVRPGYPDQTPYTRQNACIKDLVVFDNGAGDNYFVRALYGYASNGRCRIEISNESGTLKFAYEKIIDASNIPSEDIEAVELKSNGIIMAKAVIDWVKCNRGTGVDLDITSHKIREACIDRGTKNKVMLYPFATYDEIPRPGYPEQIVYSVRQQGIKNLVVYAEDNQDYYVKELWAYGNGVSQIVICNADDTVKGTYTAIRSSGDNLPTEDIEVKDKSGKIIAKATVDWSQINRAMGLDLTLEVTKIQEACINRFRDRSTPHISFIPLSDYYVSTKQQRLYFNEIADFDYNGYFTVSVDGATYPEVTVGTNGISDYIEFNVSSTKIFTVTIKYYYHGASVDSITINIHATTDSLPTKKYMFIGDSLTDAGCMQNYFKEINGAAVKLYGTRGSGDCLHEGRSGWTVGDYFAQNKNGLINPFYNPTTATFDFAYYMSNNASFADVDIVNIFLGRNNGFNTSILHQLDEMITSIKEYNSNIIVTVMGAYNVACNSSGTGKYLQSAGEFNFTAHRYNKAFYDRYSGNDSVKIIPAHCNLDNKYDYTSADVPVSAVDERTINVYTDNVHPDERGYKKLAIAISAYFKCLLS